MKLTKEQLKEIEDADSIFCIATTDDNMIIINQSSKEDEEEQIAEIASSIIDVVSQELKEGFISPLTAAIVELVIFNKDLGKMIDDIKKQRVNLN